MEIFGLCDGAAIKVDVQFRHLRDVIEVRDHYVCRPKICNCLNQASTQADRQAYKQAGLAVAVPPGRQASMRAAGKQASRAGRP